MNVDTGNRASLPAPEDGHVTISRPDNSTLWSGDAPGRRGARWGSADDGSPRIVDADGSTLMWRAP